MTTSPLFEPITVRGVTARNRIWVAPMCQYSIDARDGVPGAWHLAHLGSFARGGAGLVMAEATGVSPEARITPEDTGIWDDAQRDAWKPIVDFIHEMGAVAAIQLAHAGRKASTYSFSGRGTMPAEEGGWETVAPSAEPFPGYGTPVALDADGLRKVVDDFAAAARRSVDAGFDVLEIHAAHGYLMHQFLSPLSNHRDDEFGGSLENRARLLLQVIDAVRAEVPDVPLLVRFSATDWAGDAGWDEQQTATVAGWAAEHGADFFDISTGGNTTGVTIPVAPGYQVPFAEYVKEHAKVALNAVGLITEPAQAEAVVAEGRADAVMLGREMLRDPHFALRAAHELGVEIDYWPKQYDRARWAA
ncbi:NADH:flavin oxidoreductase/NADH oxidase [Clavibacter michiganensis subsp. michiganensis]|uniref:NADH:flavin oxidoreductase/NADH oxidase n=1 Tax=Clavibacter michiganensis TaxID=28447 RepID=UPI000B6679A0|nr:NADH:flavin oxidoreductase/NADH oxidase [Clavibacter michiganensis]MWJ18238.1 NADH:flavin oxidoreductase/NADH oxidase [Clavibacter michiganensis subsp. michiganensis]OUD99608.1 NADPH dehydrogenase [Clavibacter michiganensis subsp. michiganensis]OUE06378.1 NADPH dehydrogenase [Clavibacter michiganensis subsp. michiganensis]PPF84578.1 NADH:flavin oxidoreductase/NADH oxidase [Clavibacter michiganensis]PPF96031.1 NADH:flavin oxidoreductase/NADH oxidase [Clavibacter michiganensis]